MNWLKKALAKRQLSILAGDHNVVPVKFEKCRACKKPMGSWDYDTRICTNCAGEWESVTNSKGQQIIRRKLRKIKGGTPYAKPPEQSEIPGTPEWQAKYSTSTVTTIGYCDKCGEEYTTSIPEQRRQGLCDQHWVGAAEILRKEAWEAQLEAERLLYGRTAVDGE